MEVQLHSYECTVLHTVPKCPNGRKAALKVQLYSGERFAATLFHTALLAKLPICTKRYFDLVAKSCVESTSTHRVQL